VVGSQNWRTPGSSTPGPSFGHNLCFRCPNEQWKLILDIYTSRAFHWYKELLEARILTPAIPLWRFGSPFETPTPNMGVHLRVWGFIPSHCSHSQKHVECSRVSHLAHNLATPCLGREPKARVATLCNSAATRESEYCINFNLVNISSPCLYPNISGNILL
jgi:hypothetical protein